MIGSWIVTGWCEILRDLFTLQAPSAHVKAPTSRVRAATAWPAWGRRVTRRRRRLHCARLARGRSPAHGLGSALHTPRPRGPRGTRCRASTLLHSVDADMQVRSTAIAHARYNFSLSTPQRTLRRAHGELAARGCAARRCRSLARLVRAAPALPTLCWRTRSTFVMRPGSVQRHGRHAANSDKRFLPTERRLDGSCRARLPQRGRRGAARRSRWRHSDVSHRRLRSLAARWRHSRAAEAAPAAAAPASAVAPLCGRQQPDGLCCARWPWREWRGAARQRQRQHSGVCDRRVRWLAARWRYGRAMEQCVQRRLALRRPLRRAACSSRMARAAHEGLEANGVARHAIASGSAMASTVARDTFVRLEQRSQQPLVRLRLLCRAADSSSMARAAHGGLDVDGAAQRAIASGSAAASARRVLATAVRAPAVAPPGARQQQSGPRRSRRPRHRWRGAERRRQRQQSGGGDRRAPSLAARW